MIPNDLRAGSAYSWKETQRSLPDGGVFQYTLFNAGAVYSFDSDGEGRVALASSETAGWLPGGYDWVLRLVVGSEKEELARGRLRILVNPDAHPQGYDGRSQFRRILDAINATLEGRATDDAQQITIRGRTITSTPIPDLLQLREVYKREVSAEEAAARQAQGLPNNRVRYVRFTNG